MVSCSFIIISQILNFSETKNFRNFLKRSERLSIPERERERVERDQELFYFDFFLFNCNREDFLHIDKNKNKSVMKGGEEMELRFSARRIDDGTV